jgi:hypothetical protein
VCARPYAALDSIGTTTDGSSFSGLLTRVEFGYVRTASVGNVFIKSWGLVSSFQRPINGSSVLAAKNLLDLCNAVRVPALTQNWRHMHQWIVALASGRSGARMTLAVGPKIGSGLRVI